jgi:hypothetical protein
MEIASLCYDFSKWIILSLALVAISLTVGLLLINYTHGQVIDSPYANCIMMTFSDIQVVLATDEDCSRELFAQAVSYYKSLGYTHVGGYSDVLGEQTITLDK